MSGRSHQSPNSLSGWVSVVASVSVAAAVVGFCWEDVQSASSAVQNKISRNLKKSLGVVTSSFKSGLSGVAAWEDDAVLKDYDDAGAPPPSGVKRQKKALSVTSRERIMQEPPKDRLHSKFSTKARRFKAGSSCSRMPQKNESKKRKITPPVKRVGSSISESLDAFMSPRDGEKQARRASNLSTHSNDTAYSNRHLAYGDESDESVEDESVRRSTSSRMLRKNESKKRKITPPVKRVGSSISEPKDGGKQARTASKISTHANDAAYSNRHLAYGDESGESVEDKRELDRDLNMLEPTQKSLRSSNNENIDRDIVAFFEATSPDGTLGSRPQPSRGSSEATGSLYYLKSGYNKAIGSPTHPDSEHSEVTGSASNPVSEHSKATGSTSNPVSEHSSPSVSDSEPSEATNFATNEFTAGSMSIAESMLESESESNIDNNLKQENEESADESEESADKSALIGDVSNSDCEESDGEYSDSETGPIHIAAVEPGKWIAIPGEEDDGTTTTWMAQVLAYKSKNVITVRYLREVENASEIADIQAHYDEINDILKKARNRCFVFYETRTYKKVFREGYVNLKLTPFVILRSNEVCVHLVWDEALRSQNCLISFNVTQIRLASMKQTLYTVLNSE